MVTGVHAGAPPESRAPGLGPDVARSEVGGKMVPAPVGAVKPLTLRVPRRPLEAGGGVAPVLVPGVAE